MPSVVAFWDEQAAIVSVTMPHCCIVCIHNEYGDSVVIVDSAHIFHQAKCNYFGRFINNKMDTEQKFVDHKKLKYQISSKRQFTT